MLNILWKRMKRISLFYRKIVSRHINRRLSNTNILCIDSQRFFISNAEHYEALCMRNIERYFLANGIVVLYGRFPISIG